MGEILFVVLSLIIIGIILPKIGTKEAPTIIMLSLIFCIMLMLVAYYYTKTYTSNPPVLDGVHPGTYPVLDTEKGRMIIVRGKIVEETVPFEEILLPDNVTRGLDRWEFKVKAYGSYVLRHTKGI